MHQPSSDTAGFFLAPGVYATAIDDDVVVLSVAADAYFCLPGAAVELTLAPDRCRIAIHSEDLATLLSGAGLVVTSSTRDRRTAFPAPPSSSALRPHYDPPQWRDLATILRTTVDVARHYRGKSFAAILQTASRDRLATPKDGTKDLCELVDEFQRWIPYAPVSGKCLLRSFALRRFLRRHGHDAAWIFGVRIWPFHAHCWLQSGGVVLDDHPDRLRAYTPILAV